MSSPRNNTRQKAWTLKFAQARCGEGSGPGTVGYRGAGVRGCHRGYHTHVSSSFLGTYVTTAEATDADDPETDNAALRYSILEQGSPQLFSIDEHTGEIRTVQVGLDREVRPPLLHLESWGQMSHLAHLCSPLWCSWMSSSSSCRGGPSAPALPTQTLPPLRWKGALSCCGHSWWLWVETQLGVPLPLACL